MKREPDPTANPRSARSTLYREVADVLLEEIRTGVVAVGAMLPTEVEICARFGVSRFTAREALRRLEEAGVVVRRQGSGTRVVSSSTHFVARVSTPADILQYARDTVLVTSSTWKAASGQLRNELSLDPQREWMSVILVRENVPHGTRVGVATVCVDARLEHVLNDVRLSGSEALYEQISRLAGVSVSTIDQEFFATTTSLSDSRRLGVDPGDAALGVIRRYATPELGEFEVARTIHPAGAFRYRMTLATRASGLSESPEATLQN